RVLACAYSFATENFHRNETAQLGDPQSGDALADFVELCAVVKCKGEVAFDGEESWRRFIMPMAQIVLVEPVEIDFGDKNILPQFARSGHVGMNLSKLGDGSAIQHGAGRASRMIVVCRLRIVIERPMAEGRKQALDVALQVEEREWTRHRSRNESAHHLRIHAACGADRDALQLPRHIY